MLFQWLEHLAIAQGNPKVERPKVSARHGAVAMWLAILSHGTSGKRITVNAERIAAELSVSTRTVWRGFYQLVGDGWFERTSAPTRPTADEGEPRKAEYRMTLPRLVLACDKPSDREPTSGADLAHDEESGSPDRVPNSAGSCATPERESGSPLRNSSPSMAEPSIDLTEGLAGMDGDDDEDDLNLDDFTQPTPERAAR
jgi:hypothetical protein